MIAVLGSLNMDFVVRVERLPVPGETVLGSQFLTVPGGKGANQAYAAARLGGKVRMIGAVGRDVFGAQLKENLASAGVDVSRVAEHPSEPTGIALIPVDVQGQNSIVVAPGANAVVAVPQAEDFRGARVAMFQLETPLEVVERAIALAHSAGAITILDPAPARPLRPELLHAVQILTPNETEALALVGKPCGAISPGDAESVARALPSSSVILKLGEQGCYVWREGAGRHYPGLQVPNVDTTAAGDTFNAGLGCALAEQQPLERAVPFANAAAALSVTKRGAQASAPTREEVDRSGFL